MSAAGTAEHPRARISWGDSSWGNAASTAEDERSTDPADKRAEPPGAWAEADEYGSTPNEQRSGDQRLPDEPDIVPDAERPVPLPDESDYPPAG